MQLTKQCSLCLGDFPLDNFQKQSGTKDGLKYECLKCTSIRAADRYKNDPSILEKNKQWQNNNKDKHNDAAKRYYHSPTGKMSRNLNRAADKLLGKQRDSLLAIFGVPVPVLITYLSELLPASMTIEDYSEKWRVGFIKTPSANDLSNIDGVRQFFSWKNLRPEKKTALKGDLGVR